MDWVENSSPQKWKIRRSMNLEKLVIELEVKVAAKDVEIERMAKEIAILKEEAVKKKMHSRCLMKCLKVSMFVHFVCVLFVMFGGFGNDNSDVMSLP